MILKLSKIVHFLQICVALSKKSKSTKAIHLYPSETPHQPLPAKSMFLFQKIVCFTGVWATVYKTMSNKISKKSDSVKFNKIHELQALISSEL